MYFFIFSESGFLERIALDKEKNHIAANIEALKSENKRLQRLLDKYRKGVYPGGEIADSGYVKNGGSVLFLRELGKKSINGKSDSVQPDDVLVPLPYLRITWIAISAIVVIGLILFGRKHSEDS